MKLNSDSKIPQLPDLRGLNSKTAKRVIWGFLEKRREGNSVPKSEWVLESIWQAEEAVSARVLSPPTLI